MHIQILKNLTIKYIVILRKFFKKLFFEKNKTKYMHYKWFEID